MCVAVIYFVLCWPGFLEQRHISLLTYRWLDVNLTEPRTRTVCIRASYMVIEIYTYYLFILYIYTYIDDIYIHMLLFYLRNKMIYIT